MKTGKKIWLGTAALAASLFAVPAYAQHERRQTVSAQKLLPVDNNAQILLGNGHLRGPTRGTPMVSAPAIPPALMPPHPNIVGHAIPRHIMPRHVIAGTNLSFQQTVVSVNVGFSSFGGFGAPLMLPFYGNVYWRSGLPYWWCNFPVPGISYGAYGGYYLPFMPAYRQYYRGDMREYEYFQRRHESAPESRRLEERLGEIEKKVDEAYRRGREDARKEYEARPAAPVVNAHTVPAEPAPAAEETVAFEDGYSVICRIQYDDEARIYMNAVAKAAGRSDLYAYNTKENEVGYRNKAENHALVMKMTLPSARTMKEDDFIAYLNKQLVGSGLVHPSAIKRVSRVPSNYICK